MSGFQADPGSPSTTSELGKPLIGRTTSLNMSVNFPSDSNLASTHTYNPNRFDDPLDVAEDELDIVQPIFRSIGESHLGTSLNGGLNRRLGHIRTKKQNSFEMAELYR